MDKADIALIVSGLSFLAAGASAHYTRKMAIQDAQKMKRKSPILEVEHSGPLTEYRDGKHLVREGFLQTSITIKNLDSTAKVKLKSITAKRGVKIADFPRISQESPGSLEPYALLETIPENAFTSEVALNCNLATYGTAQREFQHGDTSYLTLFSLTELGPKDLTLNWEWLDGQPK